MKNLATLTLSLICALGVFVAPSANAASVFGSVNVNWDGKTNPFIGTAASSATLFPADAFNPQFKTVYINGNATDAVTSWNDPIDTSAANADLYAKSTATSLTAVATAGVTTITSGATFQFASAGNAQLSFNYSFVDTVHSNTKLNITAWLQKLDNTTESNPEGTAVVGGISTDPLVSYVYDPTKSFTTQTLTFTSDLFTVSAGDRYALVFTLDALSNSPAAPVPVPAALPLLGSALAGLAGFKVRRKSTT